jgi:hypothetical protein
MKTRAVKIRVTDHAVVRYLERELKIDVDSIRAHIAALVEPAAQIGATGLKVDNVKFVICAENKDGEFSPNIVCVPTVLPRRTLEDFRRSLKSVRRQS